MSSRIEQVIDEIEEYLEGCKSQKFSGRTVVERDVMRELLSELRMRLPDEIKKYQKLISNRDAIIEAAENRAESIRDAAEKQAAEIVNQANIHTTELINEHEIMQQAYAQANAIMEQATAEAQRIVNEAAEYAENYRMGAIRYTDDLLAGMQNLIAATMEGTKTQYEKFFASLSDSYDVISSNRNELYPDTESNLEYVNDEEDTEK